MGTGTRFNRATSSWCCGQPLAALALLALHTQSPFQLQHPARAPEPAVSGMGALVLAGVSDEPPLRAASSLQYHCGSPTHLEGLLVPGWEGETSLPCVLWLTLLKPQPF